jgi:hypothetical protein
MPIAAARRMVLKVRAKKGDADAYANKQGRRRSIDTIESIVESCSDRIGVYLDMPPAQLRSLLSETDVATKRVLVSVLDDLANNLSGLSELIEQQIPKLVKRAV